MIATGEGGSQWSEGRYRLNGRFLGGSRVSERILRRGKRGDLDRL